MSSAHALPPLTMPPGTARVTITIHTGPDKGSSYQLLPPVALIGRGAENDIVLTDGRASRQQAVIRFVDNKVELEDVSSRKTTTVKGKSGAIIELTHGDIICMGDTEMTFRLEVPQAVVAPPTLAVIPPVSSVSLTNNLTMSTTYQAGPSAQERVRAPQTDNGKRLRFYLICAVIGAGLFYLVSHGSTSDLKDKFTLRSAADVEKDIKTSETHQDEIALKKSKSPEEKQRSLEAQEHYLSGFRDYEKGQYARALRSFETARAIDPSHELANRYSVLAERKRDEAITNNMVDGRRYKEKHMFSRCSAALDKVLDEISNPDDIRYKESRALKRECDLMLEGT